MAECLKTLDHHKVQCRPPNHTVLKGRNTHIHTMNDVQRDCLDTLTASVVVNMQQAETFSASVFFHAGTVTGFKLLLVSQ